MLKETYHVGLYQWTDAKGNLRPIRGSEAAENNEKAMLRKRAELLLTPNGIAWLDRHGFTKTNHEDLDWLEANGKI